MLMGEGLTLSKKFMINSSHHQLKVPGILTGTGLAIGGAGTGGNIPVE